MSKTQNNQLKTLFAVRIEFCIVRISKQLLARFLVVLFALRCIIPAGYMPVFDDKKQGFNIVICTSYGAKEITVDETGQPVENTDHDDAQVSKTCPFALNTVTLASLDTPDVGGIPVLYSRVVFFDNKPHPALVTLYKTAPPRAPPLFS
jgi:hypothetical protein